MTSSINATANIPDTTGYVNEYISYSCI